MDHNEIITKLKESGHKKAKVAIVDIDGVLRGKFMHMDKLLSALEGGFGFCSVVFGWDMADEAYDNGEVTGWHTGYGDWEAFIAPETLRTIPWEKDLPFLLADFSKGGAASVCPRSLLKQMIAKAKNQGFSPVFSQEFEWFNFRENSESVHEKGFGNMKSLTPGMFGYSVLRLSENDAFFSELFEALSGFGVPLEGLHTETGPGVMEAAIQYADILESADRAVLFKTSVKQLAAKHGIIASFMAKQSSDLPGCSGHVHQSLWNPEKTKNLFYDKDGAHQMSSLMQSYLAGQLYCLPHILPMLAPTINSYKRLVEGAWAPTNQTWGVDNRTTALRAITGSSKAIRIEHRVVGSDTNPYLAMAACLASGLYGIEKGLTLDTPAVTGNGYKEAQSGRLPANLLEAALKMKDSEVAQELFGRDFVDHFTRTREWEWRQFAKEVTDWETQRYFEII